MKKAFWIIFGILVLVAAGAAGYYYYDPTVLDKAKHFLGITEPVKEPVSPPVIEVVPKQPQQPQPVVVAKKDTLQPQEMTKQDIMTNELVYFAGEEDQDYLSDEDEMLLGKWQNTINEQWYRVYTDEEAEDGYYWGYEWDENEDVTEEDLNKYGNGWFMWKKRGSKVLELATADNKGQLVPRPYTITKLFYTELTYKETNSGKKLNFLKVTD